MQPESVLSFDTLSLSDRTLASLNLPFDAREVVDKGPGAILDEIESTVIRVAQVVPRQAIEIFHSLLTLTPSSSVYSRGQWVQL